MSPFLRKVRTASSATAVQIVEKQGRVNRVVEHLGSARDEASLQVLLEKGRRKLRPDQMEFNFNYLDTKISYTPIVQHQSSTLLWQVLQDSYRALGFDQAIGDAAFEQLVLARIVEPASKVDTVRMRTAAQIRVCARSGTPKNEE